MIKEPGATPAYRILIVDDAPTVRESLRWLLENEADLEIVAEADNGFDAIRYAASLTPDVVILDIELPHLNGYAVTQCLKSLSQPPAVILLSVHSDAASRQRGAAAGSDSFIDKSAEWPHLISEVRRLVTGP